MKYLYIDSCSENLLVLAVNGDKSYSIANNGHGLKHNSILLPSVDEALAKVDMDIKDVEYVACNVGAGSFTGIRLGVTTANGLAFSVGAKRISMNAFESIAYNSNGKVLVLIDARHGNYYGGEYLNGEEVTLGNYTTADKDNYDGEVIVWNGEHNVESIARVIEDKITKAEFVDMLTPLYLKLSQAEREANENK